MHSWPFSLKENGAAITPPLHSNREIALKEKDKDADCDQDDGDEHSYNVEEVAKRVVLVIAQNVTSMVLMGRFRRYLAD